MKKIIFLLIFSAITFSSFSQPGNPPTALTKQDFLQKSKKQKTTAWVLLGGGTIAWLAGVSKYMNQNDNIDGGGEVAMTVGGIAVLSSIPFFVIASKNKKKAMSLSFKNNPTQQFQRGSFVNRSLPSLTFKIHL